MSEKLIVTFEEKKYEVVDIRAPEQGEYYIAIGGQICVALESWENWNDRATRTIVKPLRWFPERGQEYFIPAIEEVGSHKEKRHVWFDHPHDRYYLDRGLLCKTREEARQLHEAMTDAVKAFRES